MVTEVGDSKLTGSSAAFGDFIGLGFLTSNFFVLDFARVLFSFAELPVPSGDSSLRARFYFWSVVVLD